MKSQHKIILFTGIIIYATLAALALWYYQERTVFADIAYHLFYILKDCRFAVQNNRFGAVFTQLFPWMSAKLHVPLKFAMINYSEGFILYYAAIFSLCFLISKEKAFAGVMMLFSIFIVTDTFYWMQSELPQGIAFNILFFAFASRIQVSDHYSAIFLAVLMIMIFFIVFFHPLLIFVFLFFALFMLLDPRFAASRKIIWASLLAVIVITVIKNKFMHVSEYDVNAKLSIQNFSLLFPHYFNIPSNISFLKDLVVKFYLLPPTLIAVSVYYLINHLFKKLFLCWIFFFGYFALVNITHNQGAAKYYMENLYLQLSIFLIVPLMFDLFPRLSFNIQAAVLGLIVVLRIFSIQQYHSKYTAQIDWQKNFLAKTENLPQKKLLVDQKDVPADSLLEWWASPYEFWLLSTIQNNETRSILVTDDPPSYFWEMGKNNLFLTKWIAPKYSELPPRYFALSDSSVYVLYSPKQ